MPRVVVVGGGVVGLCCAHWLARRGVEVELLEAGRCGAETSSGNAGWIVPALSAPLAAPGVVREALGSLVRRGGPVRIRPAPDPALALWLWRFWRSATEARYRAGLEAMLRLNERTLELYDELQASGVDFEMHDDGVLLVALSEEHLRDYVELFERLAALGYSGEVRRLPADELAEFEPALAPGVTALYAGAERHVRPEDLTAKLAERLREDGVRVHEGVRVTALRARRGRVEAIVHAGGESAADAVVLAAGVWTPPLLATVGVRLPLAAAKGYSVTLANGVPRPRRPLYLAEARMGVTPFDGGLRLAGGFDLGGVELALRPRRVDALERLSARYLRAWPTGAGRRWTGLRPLAADGLPVLGLAPGFANLYVATGHGMLGVTLAPATGAALAELVVTGQPQPVLAPFDPGRVCKRRPAGRRR